MCGIAGIVSESIIDPGQLISMSYSIRHRGPDDEGFLLFGTRERSVLQCRGKDTIQNLRDLKSIDSVSEREINIGFVHRRLSIIDLSETGHQPMCDASGKFWITYNGEIYNYPELRNELKSGYKFVTHSDTEVILAAYSKWGVSCVERFIGMWAFAILDLTRNSILLSRDRFGIKPLYFTNSLGRIAFASEIKALLESKLIQPVADIKNLVQYIAYGNIMEKTLFKGVSSLKPGCNLHINLNDFSYTEECFYHLSSKRHIHYDKEEIEIRNYFDLLSDSVRIHLRSDVPVGSCLSGGLDSSAIVSLAAPLFSPGVFKTFTASYPGRSIDEVKYAKLVAHTQSNIDQVFCYPESDGFFNDLDKIIYHNDFPINSTSVYAQWEVMRTVSENKIKVLLDGQGADEVLGGYYPFAGIYMIDELLNFRFFSIPKNYRSIKKNFTSQINTVIGRALYYFLPSFIQKMIRTRMRLGPDLISKNYKFLINSLEVPDLGGKSYYQYSLNSIRWGLTELLRYEDRNSMAFSIESRVPFLDHRLVEFTLSLENEYKLHNGWTKYILRRATESILPKEISYRRDKIGFATPQKEWKSEKNKFLIDYINQARIPEILDKQMISSLCNTELTNPTQNSEFWKIISLIKWFEIFNVSLK
jgi:asparagine synthase (glutamine-hydrolysing)